MSVVDISGTEVTSLIARSAEVGNIQSRNDIWAQGNIMAGTGLNVGVGGIMSNGALSVFASSTVGTSSILSIGSVQTANIFHAFTNGRIGLGTSTPQSRLTIQGSGNENPFSIVTSTAGATSMLTVLTNGNVGINSSTPIDTLGVQGGLQVVGGVTTTNLNVTGITNLGNTTITSVTTTNLSVSGSTNLILTGTAGQFPYYAANGFSLTNTSTLFILPTRLIGIGTTTPQAKLTIQGDGTANPFSIVTSTAGAESMFTILTDGRVGINSSTPLATLGVQGTAGMDILNISSGTKSIFNIKNTGAINLGADLSARTIVIGNTTGAT